MPLLSIITPVFNVQNYLEDFADSLRKQDFNNWELILIDDGSSDMSGEICDLLAKKDNRIKVLHQNNNGVSEARNRALSYVNGKFVFFADSDDIFEPDSIVNLTKTLMATKADIVFVPYNEFIVNDKQHSKVTSFKEFVYSQSIEDFFEKLVNHNLQIPWATFQIVYNRNFLEVNNIKFDNSYIGAEDLRILLYVLRLRPSFQVFPTAVINYRKKKNHSLNNTIDYKSVMNRLRTFNEMCDFYEQNSILSRYFSQNFANTIIQINKMVDNNERNKCFKYVKENENLLSNLGSNLKYKISRYIWRILGIKNGTKLLGVVKK